MSTQVRQPTLWQQLGIVSCHMMRGHHHDAIMCRVGNKGLGLLLVVVIHVLGGKARIGAE